MTRFSSPLDTLASVVASALLRWYRDPLRQLETDRPGTLAHRVEGLILAELYRRHGNWSAVAGATRGGRVQSTIQRLIYRHPEIWTAPPREPLERTVTRLQAWPGALLQLLDDDEQREPVESDLSGVLTARSAAIAREERCRVCGQLFRPGDTIALVLGGYARHEACQSTRKA
jgi:hypothetical protein